MTEGRFEADASAPAQWAPMDEIRRWEKNPRRISKAAIEEAKTSLLRFGFCAPCVGWASRMQLVAGHARLAGLAALLAASPALDEPEQATLRASLAGPTLRHVPLRMREFSSEQEAAAYAIRDNGEIGAWDDLALGAMVRDLDAGGTSVSGLGLSPGDLASMGIGDTSTIEPDKNPPPRLDKRTPCARCGYDGGPIEGA